MKSTLHPLSLLKTNQQRIDCFTSGIRRPSLPQKHLRGGVGKAQSLIYNIIPSRAVFIFP